MKKLISIIFILILSITPIIFAEGRSMTNKEQIEFVNYINDHVIIQFGNKIKNTDKVKANFQIKERSTPCEKIFALNLYIEGENDAFDKSNFVPYLPFKISLELYHKHVSDDINNLVNQPLCCRGLTSFVVQELINRGIECRYVLLTDRDDTLHDVALYKMCDEWYVCDLCKSLVLHLMQKYCNDQDTIQKVKSEYLHLPEGKKYTDLLKMPKDDYKELFCNKTSPWKEIELTEEKLNAYTNAVRGRIPPLLTNLIRELGVDSDLIQ